MVLECCGVRSDRDIWLQGSHISIAVALIHHTRLENPPRVLVEY